METRSQREPDADITRPSGLSKTRRLVGALGIALSLPFFLWVPAGFIGGVPSLVDVFGVPGLRTPAAVTVFGLMLAALAFWNR